MSRTHIRGTLAQASRGMSAKAFFACSMYYCSFLCFNSCHSCHYSCHSVRYMTCWNKRLYLLSYLAFLFYQSIRTHSRSRVSELRRHFVTSRVDCMSRHRRQQRSFNVSPADSSTTSAQCMWPLRILSHGHNDFQCCAKSVNIATLTGLFSNYSYFQRIRSVDLNWEI